MSKYWNQKTNCIKPYIPGEQPKNQENVIKINTELYG